MVAQLEVSCWACHAMHKVVALASSSRSPMACWRISAVWSVCIEHGCSLSVVRLFFVLRAGLLVSFPEGMVSCKPGQELGLLPHICRAIWLLQCGFGSMGRRVQSWRRAVPAMDVDDVRCVHVSVRQTCSGCVSGSAANALGGQNLEVCSFLCPWWFL